MKRLSVALLTFTMLSTSAWADSNYPGQPGWGGANRPDYHPDHYADHMHGHHEAMHHEAAHHEEHHHDAHHHAKHHHEHDMDKH